MDETKNTQEKDELTLQFSPSRWSRRYRAEEIVQKHVEFITKASNAAKKSIPCQLNVPYGPTEREKMDVFGTDLPNESPIVIFIHGAGYWQELSREISSYVVAPLYKNKFKVAIIGYSLCPEATINQIIDQIRKAFVKCVHHAQDVGSRALYLCGHSGGATLAATLFQSFFHTLPEEHQSLLRGVFLISGIYDLVPLTKTYVNDTLKLDPLCARKVSPLIRPFIAPKDIIFFVIVGDNDTPKFNEQADLFYRKLSGLGYTADLIVVAEVDHFDIAENLNEENYEIVRLINKMEDY